MSIGQIIKKKKQMQEKNKPVKGIDIIKRVKSKPPRKYLWKGIPEGSTGLITGVAKTGKTRFTENLAMSIAVGRDSYFGFPMDGKPRKVLFVNLEETEATFGERNAKQVEKLTPDELELFEENYYSVDDNFPSFLNTDKDWGLLENIITESRAEVIVIDSLTHMLVGEIEKSSVAQAFVQKLQKLKKAGRTIIVVHHNTKGNDKPIDQNSIAGSRVILQEFDYAFGLANSPYGVSYGCMLHNKYINRDDITAYTYEIKEDGWIERGDIAIKFDLYKNPYEGSKTDRKQELYVDFFKSKPNTTLSTSEINNYFMDNYGFSDRDVSRKLRTLVEKGTLEKPSLGNYIFKPDVNDNQEENDPS